MTAQEALKLTNTRNPFHKMEPGYFYVTAVPFYQRLPCFSEYQRAIAYGQLEACLSPQATARHFGVHVKNIRRKRTRYMQQQNFKDKPRSDRPTITTQREDRYLGMTMAQCRFLIGEFP